MKQATPELINLLNNSDQFYIAELYTITLNDGMTVLRYTNADQDLTVQGLVHKHDEVQIERGQVAQSIGLDVDALDVTLHATASDRVFDLPFIQAFRSGIFDGAIMEVKLLFMPSWEDASIPPITHFVGRITVDELGANYTKFKVRSETEILNVKLPRHLIMPGCIHTVYEPGCDLDMESFGVDGYILSGSTTITIRNGLGQTAGWYDLGIIRLTDGPNVNISRTVRSYSPGIITLVSPLPSAPQLGQHFRVYPGCDKTKVCCESKFRNLSHFRGYPYVPKPETIY